METEVELRHFSNRLPYFAFFVDHFRKVNEMHVRHKSRGIWTDSRMRRLYRIITKMERNWDELQSLGRDIEAQHGYDTEVEAYFNEIDGLLKAMVDIVNSFDDIAKAMLEKQMMTLH